MAAREEMLDGIVLRFVKATRWPKNETKPLPEHFEFSGAEKEIGRSKAEWFISVWDAARITVSEAEDWFDEPAERRVLSLDVEAIRALRVPSDADHQLRVLRDPIKRDKAGANAHCAIDGLQRNTSALRKVWRAKLAATATPYAGQTAGESSATT